MEIKKTMKTMKPKKPAKFTSPLQLEYQDNGKWKLIEEFCYYTDVLPERTYIIVPEGFETNFASIPRIFWNIYPPMDPKYGKAAVIHDYLYSKDCSINLPRELCDKIFLEAMTVLGAGKFQKILFYILVRIFGESHYKKDEK